MFKKGEFIIYGTSGVCQVEDITKMQMKGIPNDRLYYVLIPSAQKGGKIFTPVDNGKTPMRRVMNREEADRLIEAIPGIEGLWISNEKLREEKYKECMKSCDCREWVRIIKTLYTRRIERSAQGKKITATDEKYLRMAEQYLYSELEIPLEVPKEQMEQVISERISKSLAE
ncbi:MAG: CarD family transcriptional regulator [Clostridiales bacterium]|nr:CarD family transcriptional regulator [Clostridiales bacterium]